MFWLLVNFHFVLILSVLNQSYLEMFMLHELCYRHGRINIREAPYQRMAGGSTHRRGQNFLWACTFLPPKNVDDLF